VLRKKGVGGYPNINRFPVLRGVKMVFAFRDLHYIKNDDKPDGSLR
jgi:hypothetical protein